MDDEKTFEIEYEGKKELVTIRKLKYGEKHDLLKSCMKTKFKGRDLSETEMEFDQFRLQEHSILRCLVKAPFPVKLEHIRDLPAALGEQLWTEVDKFNGVDEEKKENGENSGKESATQNEKPQ